MPKLIDACRYIRSKNAGPFWVTIDMFFKDAQTYRAFRADEALSAPSLAALFGVSPDDVRRFEVDDLNVVKLTFPRTHPQGGERETDTHSGQVYVPLLHLELTR